MSLNLDNMAIFVAIADAGGFTAAARALGLPKSTVSRRLSEYERSLGIALFNRSTRSLSLTDEGVHYYSNAKPVVDAAIDVGRTMTDRSTEPAGLIRLTATAAIGQYLLAPALNAFLDQHQDLQIELRLTDTRINLIEGGLDLAIRMGELEDSQLVARRLTTVTLLVVAAPDLIAKLGTPNHPSDLTNMDCLVLAQSLSTWRFADGVQVPVHWRLATGNMLLARDAALSGRGFALLPDFMVADDLLDGRLVRVLAEYPTPPVTASIVAPRQRYRSLAVRRLMEHIIDWHDIMGQTTF
jgi:DNA-binding transcriptional LysR family regulator